jgi:hypothetical protein
MMSNDSTFNDGTVPADADLGADTEHVTPDGQTTGDGEPRIEEGLVSGEHTTHDSDDETGLEHGLGNP